MKVHVVGFTVAYMRFTIDEALAGLSQAGYHVVGLGWPHEKVDVLGLDPSGDEARRCKGLCERYGLAPHIVAPPGPSADLSALDRWKRRIDVAHALGASKVAGLGAGRYRKFPSDPIPSAEFWNAHREFVALMKEVGRYAIDAGVTVTLKPHTGNTATGAHLRRTLSEIDSDGIRAGYDPGNVRYYEGVAPEDDFPLIAADTVTIVAKDHQGARAEPNFPVPGGGAINWTTIFETARDAGFKGSVAVSRVDGRQEKLSLEETNERMARARRFVEATLASTGLA